MNVRKQAEKLYMCIHVHKRPLPSQSNFKIILLLFKEFFSFFLLLSISIVEKKEKKKKKKKKNGTKRISIVFVVVMHTGFVNKLFLLRN